MKNRWLLRYWLATLTVLLAACHAMPPVANFQSSYSFTVRGHVTEDQVKTLDYIFGRLPPAMVASVREVAVQPPEHFKGDEVAHFNGCGPIICFQPDNVNSPGVVWHETAHAYQYRLDLESENGLSDFTIKWRKTAGDVYDGGGDHKKGNYAEYPKLGLLDPYARTNGFEDVAMWVENVYCFLTDRHSAIVALKENGDFHQDARYAKKLQLLNQYGFLNDEDYRKVLDFLQ